MNDESLHKKKNWDLLTLIGFALIFIGGAVFIEARIQTGWILFFAIPMVILFVLYFSNRHRRLLTLIIANLLITGGAFFFLLMSPLFKTTPMDSRLGILFLVSSTGWFGIVFFSKFLINRFHYWLLLPSSIFCALGIIFLFTSCSLLDFVLFLGFGVGIPLLVWGYFRNYFGLIIPGCLISSTSLGVFLGWNPESPEPNALARTGVMLVVFSLGWAFITLFSKKSQNLFVWWPLIPALVIGTTGWGLYIGGNPTHAGSFIGNAGSVTLIIFGVYVLLLRQGFHRH